MAMGKTNMQACVIVGVYGQVVCSELEEQLDPIRKSKATAVVQWSLYIRTTFMIEPQASRKLL